MFNFTIFMTVVLGIAGGLISLRSKSLLGVLFGVVVATVVNPLLFWVVVPGSMNPYADPANAGLLWKLIFAGFIVWLMTLFGILIAFGGGKGM